MTPKKWTSEHTDVLVRMAGKRPDCEIARLTGHAEITVRKRRSAMGLPAYHWTRKDWLLADAAGLTMDLTFEYRA